MSITASALNIMKKEKGWVRGGDYKEETKKIWN